jgi:hypothetical protein
MNARSGVVLALGVLLLGLILLSWHSYQPDAGAPTPAPDAVAAVATATAGANALAMAGATKVSTNQRQLANDTTGVRLRILDAAGLGPLPDAMVRWRVDAKNWRSQEPGHDAVVELSCDVGEEIELRVTCDGYCAVHGRLKLDAAAIDLPMQRGGAVALRVIDASGQPAAGVEVVLLPPLAAGQWEADWPRWKAGTGPLVPDDAMARLLVVDGIVTVEGEEVMLGGSRAVDSLYLAQAPLCRKTGADGVARWSGVAPCDTYRCGMRGRHHADFEPAHESRRLRVTAKGVVVGAPAPSNMSGAFAVKASELVQIGASMLGEAAVHGTVRCKPGEGIRLKLCRIFQAGGGDVQPVTTVDAVRFQQVDRNGRFRFENVRPGIYAIRACWLEDDHDIYFASSTMRLLPDMDLDLGELLPMAGATVRVRVELRELGARIGPERVFAHPRQAAASLALSFVPDSQTVADSVTEVAAVSFGVDYLLHGVPPGRLQLQARPGNGLATLPRVHRLDAAQVIDRPLSELGEVVSVAVQVQAGVALRLKAVDQHGRDVAVNMVQAVDLDSGHVQSLTFDPELATEAGARVVRIPKGRHQLCASLFVGGRWLAGSVECDVNGDATSVRLDMLPAATIRGQFVAAAERSRRSETLRWAPPAFAKRGVWLYSAMPNAQGEFVLEGVPSGVALVGDDGLPMVMPVASGQERNVGAITDR